MMQHGKSARWLAVGQFAGQFAGLLASFATLCVLVFSTVCYAESDNDNEIIIELPAKASSKIYERPAAAEYFWWDTDPAVQAELTFSGGRKSIVGSEETFREKIISVKFINPTEKTFQIKLWSRP